MGIQVQESPAQLIEGIIADRKALEKENHQLQDAVDELRGQLADQKERLKKLEQFEDLLDDDDMEWYTLPAIRERYIWRQFRARVKQTFGQEKPIYGRKVLEACLAFALRRGNWTAIKNERFNNLGNDGDQET